MLNWLADKGMYFLLDFAQRELQSMLRFSWLLDGISPAVCEFLLPPILLCVYSVDIQTYLCTDQLYSSGHHCFLLMFCVKLQGTCSHFQPLFLCGNPQVRCMDSDFFFFFYLKIIVNQFFLLYIGIQEAEQTSCQVSVPKLAFSSRQKMRSWDCLEPKTHVGLKWSARMVAGVRSWSSLKAERQQDNSLNIVYSTVSNRGY